MGIDYYGVLGITKNSEDLEIKQAFRRLALQYNPEKYIQDYEEERDERLVEAFSLIAEAYDILSDPKRRAIYDQYGEEGLKEGVPTPSGFFQPYTYHGEPIKTYKDFFGTDNPFADLLDVLAKPPDLYSIPEGRGIKVRDPPLEQTLMLSLEEIFHGGVKKMRVSRQVLTEDGRTTDQKESVISIVIRRGTLPGTRLTFPEHGDQGPTVIPADITFVCQDKAHPHFRRDGLNLIHVVDVSLRRALTGCTVAVPTLDKRTLRIPVTEVISPKYELLVEGEGMPLVQDPTKRGDLILQFNIKFPKNIGAESKKFIKRALPE